MRKRGITIRGDANGFESSFPFASPSSADTYGSADADWKDVHEAADRFCDNNGRCNDGENLVFGGDIATM